MPKKQREAKQKWELAGEDINLGRLDGRYGYTEKVRTSAPAWDWFAEGGALGPVEGKARTAEEARERVEQALGLKPLGLYVGRRARAASREG